MNRIDLKKGRERYSDLARLLMVTRKMENNLGVLGGKGKGLWEKADSIKSMFPQPQEFISKVLKIAEVRNVAMHKNPKIDDIESVLQKANDISKEISTKKRIYLITNFPKMLLNMIVNAMVFVLNITIGFVLGIVIGLVELIVTFIKNIAIILWDILVNIFFIVLGLALIFGVIKLLLWIFR